MAIQDYYKSIQVLAQQGVPNGRGGTSYTWTPEGEIMGAINQANSREIEAARKKDIEADFKLFTDVGSQLDNTKLLLYKNEYYRVVSEPKDTMQRNHHYKVLLKKTGLDQENF